MRIGIMPPDLELCAHTVWLAANGESEMVKAAVAWVIRNRLADASPDTAAARLREICRGVMADLHLNGRSAGGDDDWCGPPDAELCRAWAMTCLVWSGDVADPTDGATRCHRHDQAPAWARTRNPSALIGAVLFYR